MRIVIPGGSGHVGTALARHFQAQGHAVTVLSRTPREMPWQVVEWNYLKPGAWVDELEGSDVCINLTGKSVNCRYNEANRREIYDSRIEPTRKLNEVMAGLRNPPRVWLNAATATIYRHALDCPMDESSGELGGNEAGVAESWKFSIKVARDWEAALFSTATPRTRKVAMRIAVVMSPDRGSIFDVMLNLIRHGLGGTVGSGKQFVSWIHDADFLRAVDWLISHENLTGAVNIAAPNPLPNREFMRAFREAWGTRLGLPAPRPVLELGCLLMRTESELVLKSRRVVPGRLLDSGFAFEFSEWPGAVRDLVARWRKQR